MPVTKIVNIPESVCCYRHVISLSLLCADNVGGEDNTHTTVEIHVYQMHFNDLC